MCASSRIAYLVNGGLHQYLIFLLRITIKLQMSFSDKSIWAVLNFVCSNDRFIFKAKSEGQKVCRAKDLTSNNTFDRPWKYCKMWRPFTKKTFYSLWYSVFNNHLQLFHYMQGSQRIFNSTWGYIWGTYFSLKNGVWMKQSWIESKVEFCWIYEKAISGFSSRTPIRPV